MRFRTICAVAATVLTAAVTPTAVAAPRVAAPPALWHIGEQVDVTTLPQSDEMSGRADKRGDTIDAEQLRSARLALTPGFTAANVLRVGSSIQVTLLYLPAGTTRGVIVERTGTVRGNTVALAPGAVVVGTLDLIGAAETATSAFLTTATGTRVVTKTEPWECALYYGLVGAATIGCVAAVSTVVGAIGCAAGGAAGYMSAPAGCPNSFSADLEPESQTVSGSNGTGISEVDLTLAGHETVSAWRQIDAAFTTCSACPSRWYAEQSGTSIHFFTPLSCDRTADVWGTIQYPEHWKSDTVQVTVENPHC